MLIKCKRRYAIVDAVEFKEDETLGMVSVKIDLDKGVRNVETFVENIIAEKYGDLLMKDFSVHEEIKRFDIPDAVLAEYEVKEGGELDV